MCRHVAYLGPPIPLAAITHEPAHSLQHQAYAPTDMRGSGTISVDGFGLGWYPPTGRPVRYRRAVPIWQDQSFTELAGATVSGAILAAVRGATAGLAQGDAACAPFADREWLFSLNGFIAGWPESAVPLAEQLTHRELLGLEALTDSALLWATIRADPAERLAKTVAQVAGDAPGSRLNTLLTDGHTIWATTYGHSLWTRLRRDVNDTIVASEPLDDHPDWCEVDEGQLVIATVDDVSVVPL